MEEHTYRQLTVYVGTGGLATEEETQFRWKIESAWTESLPSDDVLEPRRPPGAGYIVIREPHDCYRAWT